MWIRSSCGTCRELSGALLDIMSKHMKMEQTFCHAVFVDKDPMAAQNASGKAKVLMQQGADEQARITAHRVSAHSGSTPAIVEPITITRNTLAREKTRLFAEWVDARQENSALQAELNRPTSSRLHDAQVKLVQAAKTAGDKCQRLLVEIQANLSKDRQFQLTHNPAPAA
jgi:hypothetical protein